MICIDNACTDVYFNLATEEYLLKHSGEEVFMLWQSEPSVILGRHQDIYAEVNLKYIREKGIKPARRFSGGGAVYHDGGNLNLTFIDTMSNPDFNRYIQRIVSMLRQLGVEACPNERKGLNIEGMKISGSAQSIYKERVLFHATLLIESDLQQLVQSLDADTEQKGRKLSGQTSKVASVKSPVANLLPFLSQHSTVEEVKAFVFRYFLSESPLNAPASLSEKHLIEIEALKRSKYQTENWIYGTAAPAFSLIPAFQTPSCDRNT